MLDLITINVKGGAKKKELQQQNWAGNFTTQPARRKTEFNGKVYGFVMAWRNVISRNADRARATKNCYENYYGSAVKNPFFFRCIELRYVDCMFDSWFGKRGKKTINAN